VVLLDNMDTSTLAKAVSMAKGQLVTEASGNMRKERIAEVSATGVDYISSGALTHSAQTLDLGLDF
jgi:nicotinate-nucleotide pyrophosphorylase (carboxylating)